MDEEFRTTFEEDESCLRSWRYSVECLRVTADIIAARGQCPRQCLRRASQMEEFVWIWLHQN